MSKTQVNRSADCNTFISAARECPRFGCCSVNHCPLDPKQDRHQTHPDDREKTCPMEKGVRQRIGAKYLDLLPLLGLTSKEAAGARTWANMGLAQRQAIAEGSRRGLDRLRTTRRPSEAKPINDVAAS
jgi:hypothetical protein